MKTRTFKERYGGRSIKNPIKKPTKKPTKKMEEMSSDGPPDASVLLSGVRSETALSQRFVPPISRPILSRPILSRPVSSRPVSSRPEPRPEPRPVSSAKRKSPGQEVAASSKLLGFKRILGECSADVPTAQPQQCARCVRLHQQEFPCRFLDRLLRSGLD